MLIHEAFAAWQSEIRPLVIAQYGGDDRPALSESWNDYTDALCKDGEMTNLQYQYCPAFDDDIPEDAEAEREFLLSALGVMVESKPLDTRPDGAEFGAGARHFRVTIRRGRRSMRVMYSQGAAFTGNPTALDVMHCLLTDWQSVALADGFESWAEDLGFDPDSRKAEKSYRQCVRQSAALERLFADVSLDDMSAAFMDY